MTEKELLYYFPYSIDKQNSFRYFVNNKNALFRKYLPSYTGGNVSEYLYGKSNLNVSKISDFEYIYENFHHWLDWYTNGKNIFSFSEGLLSMLDKTNASEITPDKFHLPYDFFYLSLKPLNIKISKGEDEIIEGVYIEHNIWNPMGQHPEGYCDLSFYFVGDFKKIFSKFLSNVKSRTEYSSGVIDKIPIGSFWNVWLNFDKQEGRENVKQAIDYFIQGLKEEIFPKKESQEIVTDNELDFYSSTLDLLDNTLNLVINCFLYLSQPLEKTDIELKFPIGLPSNFDKKLSFARTTKELKEVSEKIDRLGFTKIHYIGQNFHHNSIGKANNSSVQPHWRRGHWRNQKFGEGFKASKMIWILPTLVNIGKGEPVKGHLYNI